MSKLGITQGAASCCCKGNFLSFNSGTLWSFFPTTNSNLRPHFYFCDATVNTNCPHNLTFATVRNLKQWSGRIGTYCHLEVSIPNYCQMPQNLNASWGWTPNGIYKWYPRTLLHESQISGSICGFASNLKQRRESLLNIILLYFVFNFI